ncbi:MAG TPA: N-acetylmuramidase family protein [Pyrinomonadaceae bacterium]
MSVLKEGAKGPKVVELQTKLKQLGFISGIVDGKFGPGTKKALMAFQKSKGLKLDGVAGPITMNALSSAIKKAGDKAPNDGEPSVPLNLLTESDFKEAAEMLNCDVAAIKAVAEVESSGNGFLSDGRVKILFEGHQFHKHTKGAYTTSHPTICYKAWTKQHYTKGPNADVRGAGELARLEQAMSLDREAALKSASYGKFQIMGFNFGSCDFDNVEEFYEAMQASEGAQLKAFCCFIKANNLDGHLRKHRWASFARGYNGPAYAENKYDKKLAAAHAKYSKK